LLAVNYRIAMGKFGIDLDDGEVRLEEAVPLANGSITQEQFQLVFKAMMQTVAMYHSLIPRIIYGNLTTQQALDACEQDFLQEIEGAQETAEAIKTDAPAEPYSLSELDVHDVLAEVTRIFEEHNE
jgi:antirestriction protein